MWNNFLPFIAIFIFFDNISENKKGLSWHTVDSSHAIILMLSLIFTNNIKINVESIRQNNFQSKCLFLIVE